MKLTYDNIEFIRVRTYNDTPYGYFVKMKSNRMSDNRDYYLTNGKGKSCLGDYKKEWLPKTIQKFMETHEREIDTMYESMNCNTDGYMHYIYK